MKPYFSGRQRRNAVIVRAPKRFLDQVLWPEFSELDQALRAYLHQVTPRVIRKEVYSDASEAQEIPEALPLMGAVQRQGSILIGHVRIRLHHARCGAEDSAHFYKTIPNAQDLQIIWLRKSRRSKANN